MRRMLGIVVAAGLLAAAAMGGEPDRRTSQSHFTMEAAETNLILALHSGNAGLRLSAASVLASVGTSRSVIPLMELLHNGTEEERIVSALALSRIPDHRGAMAVMRSAKFDSSPKVRTLAGWYYEEYAVNKPGGVPSQADQLPSPYPEFTETLR